MISGEQEVGLMVMGWGSGDWNVLGREGGVGVESVRMRMRGGGEGKRKEERERVVNK